MVLTRRVSVVAVCTLPVLTFWVRGIAQLYTRHPHEDAFILFRYAEHLAAGQGIVFNPGGPPAEGATDFLWMVALAVLVRLGADVAVAALMLNTLGAGLLAWVWFQLAGTTRVATVGIAVIAACIPFIGAAHASYDGFSAQLYSATIAATFALYVGDRRQAAEALPIAALILALFRPDGALVGATFCALALARFARDPTLRSRLGVHAAGAITLGVGYFLWRRWVFGAWLPLPLYVKSRGESGLPGWDDNVDWLIDGGVLPVLVLGAALTVPLLVWPETRRRTGLLWSGVLPVGVLFAALTFALQSQNVDWRFQAPIFTTLVTLVVALAAEVSRRLPHERARAGLWVACLLSLGGALHHGKTLFAVEYIDSFAVRFGRIYADGPIALTEAGRLPYWSDAPVFDVVGLNTAETALHPATVAELEALAPDIVLYHVAATLHSSRLIPEPPPGVRVLRIEPSSLVAAVRKTYQPWLHDLGSYDEAPLPNTRLGSLVLTRFLAGSFDYDVYAVDYGSGLNHVVGIRRGQRHFDDIVRALVDGDDLPYLSYARAKGLGDDPWSCRIAAAAIGVVGAGWVGLPTGPTCDLSP